MCTITDKVHNCMKNISCKSTNLVHCVKCTRCGIQYVGQTLQRLQVRFKAHFCLKEKPDLLLVVPRDFSHTNHNDNFYVQISSL